MKLLTMMLAKMPQGMELRQRRVEVDGMQPMLGYSVGGVMVWEAEIVWRDWGTENVTLSGKFTHRNLDVAIVGALMRSIKNDPQYWEIEDGE